MKRILLLLIFFALPLFSYINLSTAEVHDRMLAGDTLLLLDVREVSEYELGHIAEPDGMLPITPANFPISSFVLSNEIDQLPKDIDIIVYCRSGSRSASASSMLDNSGFTRVYNMLGGFSSWPYESRVGGFGDHSGKWIDRYIDYDPALISSPDGSGSITIVNTAIPESEIKFYLELHKTANQNGLPNIGSGNYFRVTALNELGLPMFEGDSLILADSIGLSLSGDITQSMYAFIPGKGWQALDFQIVEDKFYRNETILRKWYYVGNYTPTSIVNEFQIEDENVEVYPNPFNNELKIITPFNAKISVYDLRGRLVKKLDSQKWIPDQKYRSGIYYIKVEYSDRIITRKITYLK